MAGSIAVGVVDYSARVHKSAPSKLAEMLHNNRLKAPYTDSLAAAIRFQCTAAM